MWGQKINSNFACFFFSYTIFNYSLKEPLGNQIVFFYGISVKNPL